ncbi:MAG: (2Fe-2S) ferredoxin domain-containing protein [Polyangiales bacterium]
MRPSSFAPRAQIFVCTNQRAADDPLVSACGATGPAVFEAVRGEVRSRAMLATLWVTRTGCLGQCPRGGCAVVVHPPGVQLVDVRPEDASSVVDLAIRAMNDRAR